MHKDPEREDSAATLLKAMENEHCAGADALEEFTTSNSMTTHAKVEWEIVTAPQADKVRAHAYPERDGLRDTGYCRVPTPLGKMIDRMESEANVHLRKANHAEMIPEELVAGRL